MSDRSGGGSDAVGHPESESDGGTAGKRQEIQKKMGKQIQNINHLLIKFLNLCHQGGRGDLTAVAPQQVRSRPVPLAAAVWLLCGCCGSVAVVLRVRSGLDRWPFADRLGLNTIQKTVRKNIPRHWVAYPIYFCDHIQKKSWKMSWNMSW